MRYFKNTIIKPSNIILLIIAGIVLFYIPIAAYWYHNSTIKIWAQTTRNAQALPILCFASLTVEHYMFTFRTLYKGQKSLDGNSLIKQLFYSLTEWKVELNRIQSLFQILFGYFLTIVTFALLYETIWLFDINAFSNKVEMHLLNSIYFSVITSATIGYGDIAPVSTLAKITVCFEVFISLFYTILVFISLPSLIRKSE